MEKAVSQGAMQVHVSMASWLNAQANMLYKKQLRFREKNGSKVQYSRRFASNHALKQAISHGQKQPSKCVLGS